MAKGLMDLVNKYKMGKAVEKAEAQYEATKDMDTRMTQAQSFRRLEEAGLGSTPVGYNDPHNQPLWEFEGVSNPFDMDRDTYSDFIESGEWDYPNVNNMLDENEIKAQMMADYDIVQEGRGRASDRMDAIIDSTKKAYDAKPKNIIQALAMRMGLGK
tara:strand:- start:711 stop:1181 length:471 start_codon:yes stop_codon:yes gene_type:complete